MDEYTILNNLHIVWISAVEWSVGKCEKKYFLLRFSKNEPKGI